VRTPRILPRILEPAAVDALLAALRTHRDRAMVEAMVLGGLRRCEVLGLRLGDLQVANRRVFIGEGKGGTGRGDLRSHVCVDRIATPASRWLRSKGRWLVNGFVRVKSRWLKRLAGLKRFYAAGSSARMRL
jgi:integrase